MRLIISPFGIIICLNTVQEICTIFHYHSPPIRRDDTGQPEYPLMGARVCWTEFIYFNWKGFTQPYTLRAPHNSHLSTLEAFGLAADTYLDSEVKTKLVRQWGPGIDTIRTQVLSVPWTVRLPLDKTWV